MIRELLIYYICVNRIPDLWDILILLYKHGIKFVARIFEKYVKNLK
jgi:hypothetical protein